MSLSRGHIPSLDGIRAVSIGIVFVAHCGFGQIVPGGFGLTIFFFLSGFLITTLLYREWDGQAAIDLPGFYIRRVLRLGPPLMAVLVPGLLLVQVGLLQGNFHLPSLLSQLFFYFNYFSLYSPHVTSNVEGLAVLWSLSVEEHFYILWPAFFILLGLGRIGIRSIVSILVLVLVWRCVRFFVFGAAEGTIYISTDTRIDSLLYGCLLAVLNWKGLSARIFPPPGQAWWVIGAALAVLLATFVIRDDSFRSTLRYTLQGLALMPLFHYAITMPDVPVFRPLNWPAVRLIGILSYTIYLVHYVIIRGLEFNGIVAQGDPAMIPAAGVLSFLVAFAIYRYVEKPLHALRRTFRPTAPS